MGSSGIGNSNSDQHHVSRNGETFGPWTVEQIAQKLSTGELAITDFAWDDSLTEWVSLMEFGDLKSYLQARKPAAPPLVPKQKQISGQIDEAAATVPATAAATKSAAAAKPAVVSAAMSEDDAIQWYVTRGQQKFGPFNFFGVVKALQDKSVFEFDYIWKEGMESWVRLAEHEKFDADSIRNLLQSLEEKKAHGDVFAQRRHARMAIENDVLINDNQSVSPGRMVEGSAGGTGLIIKNSTLIPGQLIHVHFSSLDGLPAFNAIGEIVSKKYTRSARDQRAPIHYGVRFVKMDPAAEERVKNYFKTRAQQASA
ncbi:hypothetical protein BH10BDE1_BH10BDE1_19810 [soil metagenome]